MSNTQTGPEATQTPKLTEGEVITTDTETDAAEGESEPDTYPAEVVRKLRDENGTWRARLRDAEQRADELARALFTARVQATGKLTDATDLDYSADLLNNAEDLNAAIDTLIGKKPHLKARKVSGDAGQGNRGEGAQAPTFASLLNHAS